jgi:hypothetical protein
MSNTKNHYPSAKKVTAAQRAAVIAEFQAAEAAKATAVVATVAPRTKRLTKAEKEAIVRLEQRKAKAHSVGTKIAGKATACGNATAKVGSLLWKGAFAALHGTVNAVSFCGNGLVSIVEAVPAATVAVTKVAGAKIVDEYKKA